MEAIKISYRILFTLEFSLEGYPHDLSQHLKLVLNPDLAKLLPTYRILTRKQKNAFIYLIEVIPEGGELGIPRVLLKENEIFEFQLKFIDSQLFAQTHLAGYDFLHEVMVLTNEANHMEATEVLLSKPIDAYDAGKTYKKGYLVKSGTTPYKAIRESHAGDAHAVTEVAYWKTIINGSFVSQADLQSRSSSIDLDTHMVIEIKHSSSLAADYQLLNSSSKSREVTYKIKLLKGS